MQLENRYLVIKNSDIEKFLTDEQKQQLCAISSEIDIGRQQEDRGILKAVVIEKDWPEYPLATQALMRRIWWDKKTSV